MHPILHSIFHRSTTPTLRARRTPRPAAIERLECRIAPAAVISGIGSGLHKTVVSFLDADGDRVDVGISGHGFFDVSLNGGKTNGADIDHLTIKGATASTSVAIRVTSRAAGAGSLTPGATNVNSLTSDYTGTIQGITLLSAEVQDLNLGNVALKGGLSLSVANAVHADLINQKVKSTGGMQYEAVAPGIDLNSISLASAGSITIAGAVGHAGDDFSTNDFDGAINVTGALGKLVGANSVLHGSVLAGTLSGVQVGHLHGSLGSTGDMTLDLKTLESDVSVNVGGNLNLRLGFANGNAAVESGFFGTITVNGAVSGLAAGNLDTINVRGNFAGSLNAGGDVASLAVVGGSGITTGQFTGTLSSAGNIGSISAQRGFSGGEKAFSEQGGSSVSANGNIGNISSLGMNSGTFFAGGSIGNIVSTVTARFEDAISGATIVAQDSIGTITAKTFNGSAIHNSDIESYGGNIGATVATVTNLTGFEAIANVSYTASQGTVATITATSAGESGIANLHVTANQVLDLNGTAGISSFGDGIRYSSVVSNTTIGNVYGLAQGFNGANGINALSLQANGASLGGFDPKLAQAARPAGQSFEELGSSIGLIHGQTQGNGNGIIGLTAQSAGGIAEVLGEANSFHGATGLADSSLSTTGGDIGPIIGETSGSGSGITDLTASSAGSIAAIIGNAFGQSGQHGIANATFAANGQIGNVTGISGFATGATGIKHSTFAGGNVSSIHAEGNGAGASYGIDDSTFSGSSLGNIDADANQVEAIINSHFTAPSVGMITVRTSGQAGHAISGSTIGTDAASFNYAGVDSNHSIDLTFDTTGAQGTLGSININGNFDEADLAGVENLGSFLVTGTVHGLVGNGATHTQSDSSIVYSTAAATVAVVNELGSDVTFNFAQYEGAPNGIIAGTAQSAGYASAGVRLNGSSGS